MPSEQYPPFVPPSYTPYERALIAGYLLARRAGVLHGVQTMSSDIVDQIPHWSGPVRDYYAAAEAYSRYELYYIGYAVGKDQMWGSGQYDQSASTH